MRKLTLWLLVFAAIAAGGALFIGTSGEAPAPAYRLAAVHRGAIVSSISSTGSLTAVVTVNVGSQVSGQIVDLPADFNSRVGKGQVIARIGPESFTARVRQSEAEVAVAEAGVSTNRAAVKRAAADLENARAARQSAAAKARMARVALDKARRELKRQSDLNERGIVATSKIETVQAAYDQAAAQLAAAEADQLAAGSQVRARAAQVAMAEAEVVTAEAQVKLRQAQLNVQKVDLERTIIRSPVDGVVIERNVEMGQTVAASLQAPTVFTIARDLRNMQVEANVDEADIGRIREGLKVTFTVDAFPNRAFEGRVKQIRLAPHMEQNVVTYTVVIAVDNWDLSLLPGMTANVRVIIDERPETLRLPNAALRFRPAGFAPPRAASGGGAAHGDDRTGGGAAHGDDRAGGGRRARVFVADAGGAPRPLPVTIGISDGSFTELVDGALVEGQQVIVGAARAGDKPGGSGLFGGAH